MLEYVHFASDHCFDFLSRSDSVKLSPTLSLLLVHDLLLAKRGIAAPKTHALTVSVNNHKARLSAEFIKARIRAGYASVEQWKAAIDAGGPIDHSDGPSRPRWIRVNTVRTDTITLTRSVFDKYTEVTHITDLRDGKLMFYIDEHIRDLIAVPQTVDLTKSQAYTRGDIIFQDKASCFPAYLLNPCDDDRHIIDACAAPGNKTTHVAALVEQNTGSKEVKITACERDKARALVLQKMINRAGAHSKIKVAAGQDFLAVKPDSAEFRDVTALLLDPSCSGSGIIGRDDDNAGRRPVKVDLILPSSERTLVPTQSKKRKRGQKAPQNGDEETQNPPVQVLEADEAVEEEIILDESAEDKLSERLVKLAGFQLKLLLHALSFPAARRITYSTCSVHAIENEHVVVAALQSKIAKDRGWRVMSRYEQVKGMQNWPVRGNLDDVQSSPAGSIPGDSARTIAEACIRCEKGTDLGTMGFFVAGFIRDDTTESQIKEPLGNASSYGPHEGQEEEWHGFDEE